jgi:N-acetylmuramoyl-L-alanine amidase
LGVKTGYFNLPEQNFQVNSDTDMPSCLIELGYMSSDVDNRLFVEKEDDYAKSIADAAIETAIKLDVVETSGKRKLGQQLVSAEKQSNSSSSDSDSDSDTATDTNSDTDTDTDTNTDTDNVIE